MSKDHTLTRRRLVTAGAGAAAVAAVGAAASTRLGGAAASSAASSASDAYIGGPALLPPDRLGIQLYSVRDAVSSQGFAKVFEALAGIGYKAVEFAGYTQGTGSITRPQLRALMDAYGLKGIGSHITPSADPQAQVYDDAEILGLPYLGTSLVIPSHGTTVAGWQQLADDFNSYGAAAKQRGMKYYVHNHFQEWAPTTDDPMKRGMDVLIAETDPTLVFFELDIYWAYVGQFQSGQVITFEPIDYVRPRKSRFPLFHVKDGKRNQASPMGYDIVDVGEGNIDFEAFFCAVGEYDQHWYLFENDNGANHALGSLASAKFGFVQMRHGLSAGACGPTAVAVAGFAARSRPGRVTLSWKTTSESRLLGFDVWRGTGPQARRVNRAVIQAKRSGRARGAVYSLDDRTVRRGASYTYRLQAIRLDGTRVWADSATAVA